MTNEKTENVTGESDKKEDAFKNDPQILNTTDPQEHMKGPLSSLMHTIEKKAEDNDRKDEEEKEA